MKGRRIVNIRPERASSFPPPRPTEDAPFKGVPLQMSELIRNLSDYGKNRYAMGMASAIKFLEKAADDLEPFDSVTPDLDQLITSMRKDAALVRAEINRILTEIEENR